MPFQTQTCFDGGNEKATRKQKFTNSWRKAIFLHAAKWPAIKRQPWFLSTFREEKALFVACLIQGTGTGECKCFCFLGSVCEALEHLVIQHMLSYFPVMSHVSFSCYLWLWYTDLKALLNKCGTVGREAKAAGDEQLLQGRDWDTAQPGTKLIQVQRQAEVFHQQGLK